MNQVPEHFYQQSAVVPLRFREGRAEMMLVTSRKKKRWVLPKGVRELDLSFADSAANEALEEAGVEGEVDPVELGTYEYDKWGGTCSVKVFALKVETVHEVWPEQYRNREWMSPLEAAARVDEPELKKLLLEFGERLEKEAPEEERA